ncbi:hypothetical protein KJ762_12285 [bacterium]|nr:hypothetical protein [bacterium]MBU1064082.1 hypothetical protein [bacterium]MBU1635270.1 hypothetical protein [bacterium]MBU1874119.1 hypothetical protein [bacterium]
MIVIFLVIGIIALVVGILLMVAPKLLLRAGEVLNRVFSTEDVFFSRRLMWGILLSAAGIYLIYMFIRFY